MKKITISVAVLLSSVAAKAQTEYIDVRSNKNFKTSTMLVYNDDNYKDLEHFKLGRFNNSYHYVNYSNVNGMNFPVIVLLNDNEGNIRELCTKTSVDSFATCKTIDSFATKYKLEATTKNYEVWISKPNLK
tara:strand:- start:179 stop:571 length:393 start_codon:yes stop_codon:yes gene_type:complete